MGEDLLSSTVEAQAGRLQSIQPFRIQAEAAIGSPWLWLSLVIGLLLVEILFARKLRSRWPPGPTALPILGCLLSLRPDRPNHRTFASLAEKYGPLMYFPLGMKPTIILSSPEMSKLMLKDMDRVWSSRPKVMIGKHMGFDFKSIVFTEIGDHHRRLKRMYQDVLFSPKRVASSASIREREWSRGVLSILGLQHQISQNSQTAVNLTKIITDVTINTLLLVTVGEEIGLEKVAELKGITKYAIKVLSAPPLSDFIPFLRFLPGDVRLERVMKETADNWRRFFKEIIAQARLRRAAGREGDEPKVADDITSRALLHVLVSLEGDEEPTDDEITIWLLDSIIPGTETSVSATDWTMGELFRNPHIVKRAVEELDSVVGKDRMVRASDIHNLPFLQAIVKESLRLHPTTPLALPHMSIEACEMKGYKIPARTMAMVNLWALGQDARYWKDPLLFNPDRFMDSDVDVLGQNFEVLPFSSGRRGCVGKLLGLAIVYLNVATMVHCFDWTVDGDVDMTESIGVGCPRAKPLMCSATPRLPPVLYESLRPTS